MKYALFYAGLFSLLILADLILPNHDYELIDVDDPKGLLILFPSYGGNSENIKKEFDIEGLAATNKVSILMINVFNSNLALTNKMKKDLCKVVLSVIKKKDLDVSNAYIGGFSSGGNTALLLSDYLVRSQSLLQPQGVFAVDAPVDLLSLYRLAQKNQERNIDEKSLREAEIIQKSLLKELGNPDNDLSLYEKYSPYIAQTSNIENVSALNRTAVRFYTEPDSAWWKENRGNEPEELNAHWLKMLQREMRVKLHHQRVGYIATTDRGYRSDGARHPHSWSIVDKKELFEWIVSTQNK